MTTYFEDLYKEIVINSDEDYSQWRHFSRDSQHAFRLSYLADRTAEELLATLEKVLDENKEHMTTTFPYIKRDGALLIRELLLDKCSCEDFGKKIKIGFAQIISNETTELLEDRLDRDSVKT